MTKSKKGTTQAQAYEFQPDFELQLAKHIATSSDAWSRIGAHIDTDLLKDPIAKMVAEAVVEHVGDTGSAPASPVAVLQRLTRKRVAGKVQEKDVKAATKLLLRERFTVDIDALVTEAAPIIRRSIEFATVNTALDLVTAQGDVGALFRETAEALERVGVTSGTTTGLLNVFDIKVGTMERCPTGIAMLDTVLAGGQPRGKLGVWVARQGVGKTTLLVQTALAAQMHGYVVAFASIELLREDIIKKYVCLATGVGLDFFEPELAPYPVGTTLQKCHEALGRGLDGKPLPPFFVQSFPGGETKPADVFDWVRNIEKKHGVRVDMLVVDYADELIPPKTSGGNSYKELGDIYRALVNFGKKNNAWVWTASQVQRVDSKNKGGEALDDQKVGGSQKKVDLMDLGIKAERDAVTNEVSFTVFKNRNGERYATAGPMSSDFATCRVDANWDFPCKATFGRLL